MILAWFDGVCEPRNPGGHGAYGIYILRDDDCTMTSGGYIGHGKNISNNVAEYKGFIRILELLTGWKKTKHPIFIQGDSKLVIEQMLGNWRMKQGIYLPYAHQAKKLLKQFSKVDLKWIPREQNNVCDKLAKDVLRKRRIKFRLQPE